MKNYIRAACAAFTLRLLLLKQNASGVICAGGGRKPVIPALGRQRQEDGELEASLGDTERPFLNNNKTQNACFWHSLGI